jgi:hypothetical protein
MYKESRQKNEASKKTTEDCAQHVHKNQKKNIANRSTPDEKVASIHDYVG